MFGLVCLLRSAWSEEWVFLGQLTKHYGAMPRPLLTKVPLLATPGYRKSTFAIGSQDVSL